MALAPEEVGARIAQARKQRGWTHEQFALQAGVGLRTVQRWQKGVNPKDGKSWLPRLGTLMELADLLGVSRSFFVEEEAPAVAPSQAEVRQMVREEVEGALEPLEQLLQRLLDQAPPGSREAAGEDR